MNKTRWIVGALLAALAIYCISSISEAVLSFTAVIVWWYTDETFKLRSINNQMLSESVRPHLKLQYKYSGIVRKEISEMYRHPMHQLWTSIEVLNEGQGTALNLEFSCSGKDKYTRELKSIAVVRGNGGAAQLAYMQEDKNDTTLNVYEQMLQNNIEIEVAFDDSLGNRRKTIFYADRGSADTFSIKR